MKKRNITEKEREKDRQNALRGSEMTRGKPRGKSKYGSRSWGFNYRAGKTTPRKYDKGKKMSHIFRFGKKTFVALISKNGRGKKKPFTATIMEAGKTQTDLTTPRISVEGRTFKEAQKKAVKEFKSEK